MGDRANVVLNWEDSKGSELYLYTHSNGYRWLEDLRQALDFGRQRWTDDIYLPRIIVSRMFAVCANDVRGGGISPFMGDGYIAARVYLVSQEVHTEEDTYSFAEFVDLGNLIADA